MPCTSSYLLFSLRTQAEISRELGPSASVNDVAKKIYSSWKKLSDEERHTWEKRVERAKHQRILTKKRKNMEKKCDKKTLQSEEKVIKVFYDRPKRPMSAYIHFSKIKRPYVKAHNLNMNGLDITKLIGEMWNQTTTREKSPFLKLEEMSRNQYKRDMADCRANITKNKQQIRAMQRKKFDKSQNTITVINSEEKIVRESEYLAKTVSKINFEPSQEIKMSAKKLSVI